MTVFDRAWALFKAVPQDWNTPIDDLPFPSNAYREVIRLLSVVDINMGWTPTDWSVLLKTDADLLRHLEEESQHMRYGAKYQQMLEKTLFHYQEQLSKENMDRFGGDYE